MKTCTLLKDFEWFDPLFFLNRAEEITMREDYGNLNLDTGGDDGFGDVPGLEMDGTHSELRTGSLSTNQVSKLSKRNHSVNEDGGIFKNYNRSVNHLFKPLVTLLLLMRLEPDKNELSKSS